MITTLTHTLGQAGGGVLPAEHGQQSMIGLLYVPQDGFESLKGSKLTFAAILGWHAVLVAWHP